MAVTQSVVRLALRQGGDLSQQINIANDLLVSYNKETMFVTLFCCIIDLKKGIMTYCNCGHNAPFLLRSGVDAFERLKSTGIPMGLDFGVNYCAREIPLASNDRLVLFTDGITEAMNSHNEQYGEVRLEHALRKWRELQPCKLVNLVIDAAREFAGDAPQSDDMTCLSMAYRS
jgi:sigma-B regulation protein RsbU (phosphoserine phosphatase)